MNRILIIGCPGSGKSTFARALQARTGLPLYYLDMLYHKPDRTVVPQADFDRALDEILHTDRFIIDGNYARTLPHRLAHSDAVFFLDYPLETCLEGIEARRGKPRPDMPWIEQELDEDFVQFVRGFHDAVRPKLLRTLSAFSQVKQVVFHARDEAEAFLSNLCQNTEVTT